MATIARNSGPRAMAGLGAAQQQEVLDHIQGRLPDRKERPAGRDEAPDDARAEAPEASTGKVLDRTDAPRGKAGDEAAG